MKEILGDRAHVATPIVAAKKLSGGSASKYELLTTDGKSVGVFDDVVFACHPPTTRKILAKAAANVDPRTMACLEKIEYADNVIYVHSDASLMPARRRAWSSWNCLGKESLLTTPKKATKKGEAFEGGESGFGNTTSARGEEQGLEGEQGRMKAVYVTYWLNRLQTLETDVDVFVSLNPHHPPAQDKTFKRLILAHPQFNPGTVRAREALDAECQGKDGLWFCGAWEGYGFHEDGCRSGFRVATKLSGMPLPWGSPTQAVLPPPDFSSVRSRSVLTGSIHKLYKALTYDLPVALCRRFIYFFLDQAVKQGKLRLKFNDGSVAEFGDGSRCGSDASPVTMRVFDPWFFVKTALEYDLGLAR